MVKSALATILQIVSDKLTIPRTLFSLLQLQFTGCQS